MSMFNLIYSFIIFISGKGIGKALICKVAEVIFEVCVTIDLGIT